MKYACDTIELKKAMAENQIDTIGELAKKSKVSRNTVGRIVNGKEQPSANVMYKLAEALKLTPERAGEIFFAVNLRKM